MFIFFCIKRFVDKSHNSLLRNASHTATSFSYKFSSLTEKQQAKANGVKIFLKNHGFSDTQVSKVAKRLPTVLLLDTHRTLLPKIEFLSSIGIPDIPVAICRAPSLLTRSLEGAIVPAYNVLKSLLCGNQQDVVKSIRRDSNILVPSNSQTLVLNVGFLRGLGWDQERVSRMISDFPFAVYQRHDAFKRSVEDVLGMGFEPSRCSCIIAVYVKCVLSEDTWERRMEIYRSWGVSDEDILLGFRKYPAFMNISDENISRTMDSLVNTMGWEATTIVRDPRILLFNLERRIIPRCRVIKILMSNGLVKKTLLPSSITVPNEKIFLDRYVSKYKDVLPELNKIYRGDAPFLGPGVV